MKKALLTLFLILAVPSNVYAGPYVSSATGTDVAPFANIGGVLQSVFVLALVGGAILLFLYFLLGAIQWLTSGGDKAATQAARDRITSALVGFLLILAIYAIFEIIGAVFGINPLKGIKIPGTGTP